MQGILALGLCLLPVMSVAALPAEPANPVVLKVTTQEAQFNKPKDLFTLDLQSLQQAPPTEAWTLPLKGTLSLAGAEKLTQTLAKKGYVAYYKKLGHQYQVLVGPTLSAQTLKYWQKTLPSLKLPVGEPMIYAFDRH